MNACLQGPLRGRCEGQVQSGFFWLRFLSWQGGLRPERPFCPRRAYLSPPRMTLPEVCSQYPVSSRMGTWATLEETLGLGCGPGSRDLTALISPWPSRLSKTTPAMPSLTVRDRVQWTSSVPQRWEPPWPFCLHPVVLLLLPDMVQFCSLLPDPKPCSHLAIGEASVPDCPQQD